MDPSASIFPCVLDAPPRHFRVPPTAPAPAADASDFEMLCDRLVLQGVELAQELKDFLEAAVQRFSQAERSYEALLGDTSRFWRWLELLPAGEEDQEKLLPLPVPAVYPLSLQQMDFVVNGLDDVKTAVQVLSGSVDNFETQREREQAKLCRLLEQLLQAPTCQCEVREASSSQRLPTPTAPMAKKSGSTTSGAPIKVQLPWASRLEVPLMSDRVDAMSSLIQSATAFLDGAVDDTNRTLSNRPSAVVQPPAPNQQTRVLDMVEFFESVARR